MKNLKIIKSPKLFLSVLLLISVLFTLCACTAVEQNEYAEQMTESILDGIVAKDYDTTRAIFKDIASDEAFEEFFDTASRAFDGTKSYELKQVGWHTRFKNGVSTYSVTFEMETDTEERYLIETHFLESDHSLYYFNISPSSFVKTEVLILLQIVFVVISLASCAFCIWMIVDCAKRKIGKKPLWIIIILLSISLTFIFGHEAGSKFAVSLIFPMSTITTDGLSAAVKLTIPVGAIIYCILRKQLTHKNPVPEVIESADSVSETEVSAEPTSPESENE